MIKRQKTRQIKVGPVKIGASAPISIQSMAKTDTRHIKATVNQIKELEKVGCEIVRVAVLDQEAARAIKQIKKKIKIPIVADIHFSYKLALEAIKSGADKIRLNPGNISKEEEIKEVVTAAKRQKIPIRVGVNSGSLAQLIPNVATSSVMLRDAEEELPRKATFGTAENMVTSALNYIKILERFNFYDIVVSLKASDVPTTISAYRLMSSKSNYPLHLGVTAAGLPEEAIVKSAVGMGALLSEGIGDTLRVSIAGNPIEEVETAKQILSSLKLRSFGPELIVCPTCGRCQVNVVQMAQQVKNYLNASKGKNNLNSLKIAVMGCIVNGPGEAKEADIGFAGGKGMGIIFKKGKVIKKVKEHNLAKELLKEL